MKELLDHFHYDIVVALFPWAEMIPVQFVYIAGVLAASGLIVAWMALTAMGWILYERKIAGWIQVRYGPNRVHPTKGPLTLLNAFMPTGWLQSLADGIKLLGKEDIVPRGANRFLYELSPVLVFAGAFIPYVVIPFSQHAVIADMNIGLFYVLAFGSLEVIGILMAGWAPNSKWSLYGGMRLAAQMLSYEIPLGLSLLTVVILAGSLNLTDIILWQTTGILIWDDWGNSIYRYVFGFMSWSIFKSPLAAAPAALIFYVAALAETKRAPFDLPEAESELVSGFHTEYTGIRFSYFFLAEYSAMYIMCVLGTIVFLGGWHYPFPAVYYIGDTGIMDAVAQALATANAEGAGWLDRLWVACSAGFGQLTTLQSLKVIANELFGAANLILKSFALLFLMIWIRWTYPRVRIDQVIHICFKILLPLSLFFAVVASFQAVIQRSEYSTPEARRAAAMSAYVSSPATIPAEDLAEATLKSKEHAEE